MRWRYRKYSYHEKQKFFFSEKDIDFTTEYLDYSHFLLQEFFSADLDTRRKISKYYSDIYGSQSFNYLQRKYSEWANGDYHLTDLMKGRILAFMPEFLNSEANHKLGIHEFMATIKNNIKSFLSYQKTTYRNSLNLKDPQDVVSIFNKEYEKIQGLTIRNSRFNVLSEDEKTEALEISKYILEVKLQKLFDQIDRDFRIFLPFMNIFNRGSFYASYFIESFNLKVDITKSGTQEIELPKFKIEEIEANSRFKEYSDKYLAYELVSIHKEANKAISKSFLNSSDIQLFHSHYEALSHGDSEASMNSNFNGEGGILSIRAQMKPYKLIKSSLIISSIKLLSYIIVTVGLGSMAISIELFPLLIYGGIIVCIFVFAIISEEFKKLKSLTRELITYGK